jgi:hypothetical protein
LGLTGQHGGERGSAIRASAAREGPGPPIAVTRPSRPHVRFGAGAHRLSGNNGREEAGPSTVARSVIEPHSGWNRARFMFGGGIKRWRSQLVSATAQCHGSKPCEVKDAKGARPSRSRQRSIFRARLMIAAEAVKPHKAAHGSGSGGRIHRPQGSVRPPPHSS